MLKKNFNFKNIGTFLCVAVSSVICNVIVCFIKLGFSITYIGVSLIFFPIILSVIVTIMIKSSKIRSDDKLNIDILLSIRNGMFLSVFMFLIIEFFDLFISNKRILVAILFFSLLLLLLGFILIKIDMEKVNKSLNEQTAHNIKSNLFSTYYINFPKVFEISMLINNRIMTSIENEVTTEQNNSIEEKSNASLKIDYLNSIKTSMDFDKSITKSNSEKSKVVENFDVKTTKSNLLDIIINKSIEFNNSQNIKNGDLIIFKNAIIKLKNQQESMQIMKMLIGGAFNGSVLSGETEGFNMQLNMSSLINSVLKDCSYELECEIGDFVFEIKIPMSFENDFENSHNIYDLLTGEMTIVGIYTGEHNIQEVKGVYELFNTSSLQAVPANVNNKIPSKLKKSTTEEKFNEQDNEIINGKSEGKQNFVDVIAIIQNINLNERSDDNEKNICVEQ